MGSYSKSRGCQGPFFWLENAEFKLCIAVKKLSKCVKMWDVVSCEPSDPPDSAPVVLIISWDSSRSQCTHLGLSVVAAAAPVRMFVPLHLNGAQHRALPTGNSSTRPHTRREKTAVLRWSRAAPAPLDPGLTHRWSARESERPGPRVWGGDTCCCCHCRCWRQQPISWLAQPPHHLI